MVMLIYTNAPVSRAAQWWAEEVLIPPQNQGGVSMHTDGETLVPPCFLPFCFMSQRLSVHRASNQGVDRLLRSHRQHHPLQYIIQLEEAIKWGMQQGVQTVQDAVNTQEVLDTYRKGFDIVSKENRDGNEEAVTREDMLVAGYGTDQIDGSQRRVMWGGCLH